jgi:hypothetical protein
MGTISVLDSTGATQVIQEPLAPGRAADAASRPVALSNEDVALITSFLTSTFATTNPDTRPSAGNITAHDTGSASASGQNAVAVITGAPTAGSVYSQPINGQSTARILVTGTWTGTLAFEGSPDGGTTWIGQTARVTGTGYTQGSVTANGLFTVDCAALTNLRVRATAAMTGTAVVQAAFAQEPGFVQITNPLRLTDNSSGAQASIKPASTLPATTDTAIVVGAADGNLVTLGSKADAKATATDTTPLSIMSVLKQVSASIQAASASLAGTMATSIANGAHVTFGAETDAKSAATDSTAVTAMQVWKQISASVQSAAVSVGGTLATSVTGTVATSLGNGAHVTFGAETDAKSAATDSTGTTAMQIWKQISFSVQAIATSVAATLTVAVAAGTNLMGRAVADASAATGGIATTARLPSSAASTNATNVKTTAGRVYSASGKNNAAYDVFLVLYDASTNPPVPGTTTIRKKIVCPAGQAFVYDWPVGLSFATGIGYAFTKLVADADATALVAADITAFNLDYV